MKVLSDGLDMVVEARDIDDCFFIEGRELVSGLRNASAGRRIDLSDNAPMKSNRGATSGIFIMSLTSRRIREDAMQAWRRKKSSCSGVMIGGSPVRSFTIRERLCRSKRLFLKEVKSFAGELGWKYVWTSHGRVLMRRNEGEKAFIVSSLGSLKSMAK